MDTAFTLIFAFGHFPFIPVRVIKLMFHEEQDTENNKNTKTQSKS